jgi:RHS repeat-associated protein
MKTALIYLFVLAGLANMHAQTCSTCGKLNGGAGSGRNIGPSFNVSLGSAQYGETAGHLMFSSTLPDPLLFTPAALQFTASKRPDVIVVTTNLFVTNSITVTNLDVTASTNVVYVTNHIDTGTSTFDVIVTNFLYDQSMATNVTTENIITTNLAIRQVNAPLVLADIPVPPTSNGYVINFYYASQVGSVNPDGTYAVAGSPFDTWLITNSNPSTINQLRISETNLIYNSTKQWNYSYATSTGIWSVQDLAGVQENMAVSNLNANAYQTFDSVQYVGGAIVQQNIITYSNFSWGLAPIQIDVGSAPTLQTTTCAYDGSGRLQSVTHPDGSWEYYYSYDTYGNPTVVHSSFGDVALASHANGRQTTYIYDPTSAGVSTSGDNGSANPRVPRLVSVSVQTHEISRQYSVFPSVNERLDIQCTMPGAAWYASGNLITTNWFYTSGANQYALKSVLRPDGTMSTYNYLTNGIYQTNITVTGQPDATDSYVIDGVSNVVVLNIYGYNVLANSYDVSSAKMLSRDVYGNFDSYGRPQQIVHLDGTTNITQYACCGLDLAINPDRVMTQYLYDPAKRQIGYEKIYNATPITFTNNLDAANRILQSIRIGSDNSVVMSGQSAYDLAGEITAQTNALNGVTYHTRTINATTGGLIRTTINPDGGIVTNLYYVDGSIKETIGSGVHGIRYATTVESDGGIYRLVNWEIKQDGGGSDTSEYTKIFTDLAGRSYETVYASASGSPTSLSSYNVLGQLASQTDPDGVVTLYQYNAKGELAYTAIDMNRNGTIDFSGTDRITQTTNDIIADHSTNVRRTRTYVWDVAGSGTPDLTSINEISTDGLNIWQTQYRDSNTAVTNHVQTVPGVSRTVTTTMPDASYTVSAYSYGRLVADSRYDSSGVQIGGTTYGYDAHGRQYTMTDARNGTTTLGFNNADLVATNTTPNPGSGSPETTTTAYDKMLRRTTVTQPDSTTVTSVYLLTGELGLQSGSRTYPVGYGYDYAGRMQKMTNWSNYGGGTGARVTTWNYDSYRGWLNSKTYDDGHGPTFAYTSAGRLYTRAWVRGITTTYAYDNAGGLYTIGYSDSTPGVTYTYDRLGRQSTAVWNSITDTMTYNLANELLGESFSGGSLAGLSVTNGYDQYLRRTNLTSLASSTVLAAAAYGYDNASRLATVSDGNNGSAAYTYLANSPLVSQLTFKQGSTTRMTTTKQYDYLNRLTQISSAPSASYTSPLTFNYNYNPADQRTKDTLADGSYWIYGYDSLGQVTNACKYFADNTPVAGQQFNYTFDTIGNRTLTKAGGDASGANLRSVNYTNNTLNQVIGRDVPAYVDVMGASILTNSVTVNGQTTYRKEEYFRQQLPANNSSSALWTNMIVSGGLSVTGNVYVAKQPEVFGYDADGNLTSDGRFNFTWDGENRLINLTSLSGAPTGSKVELDLAYDFKSRRIQKIVSTNNGTAYFPLSTNKFLYDGWNLVAETKPNNSLIRSYVWGTDLGGSMQGAGGVGGLLEVSYYGSSTTNCFLAFDGNGNVAALINAADGTVAANYEYAAFGEPARVTGVMARNNPFRFSTKYADDESDLFYYGYRYYKPSTGTWPSRDPFDEIAGNNLYGFNGNNAINSIDADGRITVKTDTDNIRDFGCGAFEYEFTFKLDHPPTTSGFIVQKVSISKHWYNCGSNTQHTYNLVFWEFRLVKKSDNPLAVGDDASDGPFFGKFGDYTSTTEIRWYPWSITGVEIATWPPNKYSTGPTSSTQPSWWGASTGGPINGEMPSGRSVSAVWNCCCGIRSSTVYVSPHL